MEIQRKPRIKNKCYEITYKQKKIVTTKQEINKRTQNLGIIWK